jgi:hypothetical protein
MAKMSKNFIISRLLIALSSEIIEMLALALLALQPRFGASLTESTTPVVLWSGKS